MELPLKTLDQHNAEASQKPELPRVRIACPNCGAELWRKDWNIRTSYPPQMTIHCRAEGCGWEGFAVC